jgi:hypothetical protein
VDRSKREREENEGEKERVKEWIDYIKASIHPECVPTRRELLRCLREIEDLIELELRSGDSIRRAISVTGEGSDGRGQIVRGRGG